MDKTLLMFDVDGTLTAPRQVISPHVQQFLMQEMSSVSCAIISSSDFESVSRQLGAAVLALFDYVFCENGLVLYRHGHLLAKKHILDHIQPETLHNLIHFSLQFVSDLRVPMQLSEMMDFRSGLLNLRLIGKGGSLQDRQHFARLDDALHIRARLIQALQERFADEDLIFAIGGQTSVDIFPRGWDKRCALDHVQQDGFSDIHFFGDKTHEGGNDYHIFSDARTQGHTVRGPDDTVHQVAQLLHSMRSNKRSR